MWIAQQFRMSGCGQVEGLENTLPVLLALSASSMPAAAISPRTVFPRSSSFEWAEYLTSLIKENDKTK